MTSLPDAESREPAAAQVLSNSIVGGDNVQIGSARDVIISPRPSARRHSLVRWLAVGVILATAVAVAQSWPALVDALRDASGPPPLVGTASARINVGDSLAMADAFSTDEHAQLLRDPTNADLIRILTRHGAARVSTMNVVLILEGERNSAIRIIDVRPRILRSGPPPTGTCLTLPAQGGAEEYKIVADLDRQRPEGGGSRFLPKSIDLAYGERTTVEFTATAKRRWYEWDIEVVYSYKADSKPQSTFFRDPDGQPFRVTAEARRYSTVWNDPSALSLGFRVTGRNKSCRGR
ncbi:hypothetical protein AB0C33_01270 [Nonomuraea sp. NPDC048881]|uniref:hypothetical protein n=1 Tax=Nonomuraea sp. NPDC048881 TaxID=3155030 RepID=UPI0033F6786A